MNICGIMMILCFLCVSLLVQVINVNVCNELYLTCADVRDRRHWENPSVASLQFSNETGFSFPFLHPRFSLVADLTSSFPAALYRTPRWFEESGRHGGVSLSTEIQRDRGREKEEGPTLPPQSPVSGASSYLFSLYFAYFGSTHFHTSHIYTNTHLCHNLLLAL